MAKSSERTRRTTGQMAQELQAFDLQIKYRKGSQNAAADTLSRAFPTITPEVKIGSTDPRGQASVLKETDTYGEPPPLCCAIDTTEGNIREDLNSRQEIFREKLRIDGWEK